MENPNDKNKSNKDLTVKEGAVDPQTGLDNWNKRLDENLEPKDHNDEIADEKAKNFSEQFGNGDDLKGD